MPTSVVGLSFPVLTSHRASTTSLVKNWAKLKRMGATTKAEKDTDPKSRYEWSIKGEGRPHWPGPFRR